MFLLFLRLLLKIIEPDHFLLFHHILYLLFLLSLIPYLVIREEEMDILRDFIKSVFNEFLVKKNNYATHMRRLICFYDWKKYGWYDTI